jgi:hypothetical protein
VLAASQPWFEYESRARLTQWLRDELCGDFPKTSAAVRTTAGSRQNVSGGARRLLAPYRVKVKTPRWGGPSKEIRRAQVELP